MGKFSSFTPLALGSTVIGRGIFPQRRTRFFVWVKGAAEVQEIDARMMSQMNTNVKWCNIDVQMKIIKCQNMIEILNDAAATPLFFL